MDTIDTPKPRGYIYDILYTYYVLSTRMSTYYDEFLHTCLYEDNITIIVGNKDLEIYMCSYLNYLPRKYVNKYDYLVEYVL